MIIAHCFYRVIRGTRYLMAQIAANESHKFGDRPVLLCRAPEGSPRKSLMLKAKCYVCKSGYDFETLLETNSDREDQVFDLVFKKAHEKKHWFDVIRAAIW